MKLSTYYGITLLIRVLKREFTNGHQGHLALPFIAYLLFTNNMLRS